MQFIVVFFALFSVSLVQAKNCQVQFDEANSVIEGTGFKYTEKTGVAGRFPSFQLNKNKPVKSEKELLEGLQVTVDLMSLDSGNALRDKNMRETLFAGIIGDSKAVVTVKSVGKDSLSTEIKLNDKTQKVDFKYEKDKKGFLVATGSFDAVAFALGDQIAALKKRCGSLHTGSDGKSVTWTDFALKVSAKIKEVCKK